MSDKQEPVAEPEAGERGWSSFPSGGKKEKDKSEDRPNPYQNWIDLARAVDAWRPWPRLFISIYIYILYRTIEWFLALPSPTMEQAGLISVVTGIGAAWFGLYVKSGSDANS